MASLIDNLNYYRKRAEEEQRRARTATCPEAACAHASLADHYGELARQQQRKLARHANPGDPNDGAPGPSLAWPAPGSRPAGSS